MGARTLGSGVGRVVYELPAQCLLTAYQQSRTLLKIKWLAEDGKIILKKN